MWCYQWKNGEGEDIWKVIIAGKMKDEIIKEHHNGKLAGYFGVKKTMKKIKNSPYYWPAMTKSVEEWIQRCDTCQRTKPEIRKQVALAFLKGPLFVINDFIYVK